MRKKDKLVCGVGFNDSDYVVNPTINGKVVWCPFYRSWANMLVRCYSINYQIENPSYIDCTVCEEWLTFSNFKSWMETQDWEGKQLDKDLLVEGNKVYSPETCVFVDSITNLFTIDHGAARGEWPVGVSFHKRNGKFRAQCRNPFTNKKEHLGCFTCPNEAHLTWGKRKHELAYQLAELQSDERVAKVLRERYAPDKIWKFKKEEIMNVKIKDFWWSKLLVKDNGDEIKINGQLVEFAGNVGRLYVIQDVSSHCGGHGMGEVRSSQVIMCTDKLTCVVLEDGTSGIKLLEE